ncbi:MAG: NAD(P)/FAD-dependent oxidoreductase, partial [Chloroflexi bacterium]|nr:NAD(P)/FAD-dependent oxidoreductase [Chloroflexota bacterium]
MAAYDAVVVGSGPNGLAAAIVLAQAGKSVLVVESRDRIGGGVRTSELTLPGFLHDDCSAVHPMGVSSPFFRTLPLADHRLHWLHPAAPLAHPLDDGTAVMLERSVDATAAGLRQDERPYLRLMKPLVHDWELLFDEILRPLSFPRHPFAMARFGTLALCSAAGVIRARFRGVRARALFAGISAHSMLPLDHRPSAAFGLVLAIAGHASGWPIAQGGSGEISRALSSYLKNLGGEIRTESEVKSLDQLPPAPAVFMDVSPR